MPVKHSGNAVWDIGYLGVSPRKLFETRTTFHQLWAKLKQMRNLADENWFGRQMVNMVKYADDFSMLISGSQTRWRCGTMDEEYQWSSTKNTTCLCQPWSLVIFSHPVTMMTLKRKSLVSIYGSVTCQGCLSSFGKRGRGPVKGEFWLAVLNYGFLYWFSFCTVS